MTHSKEWQQYLAPEKKVLRHKCKNCNLKIDERTYLYNVCPYCGGDPVFKESYLKLLI